MSRRFNVAVWAVACSLSLAPAGAALASDAPPALAAPAQAASASAGPAGSTAPLDASAAPAQAATPATGAAPVTGPAESQPAVAPQPAATPSAVAEQGPMVGYVKHTKPPVLIDSTPGKAAFALVGTVAEIAAGHDIVVNNDITDPSGDMAREIAAAYAAAHGAKVASSPLLDDHLWTLAKGSDLAAQSNGARYVVDVEPPGLNLIYFSFDWTHFDLMFMDRVRIIDTSNGTVVAKARCFLKSQKTPAALTHSELLADNAAKLKQLIASKSQSCVDLLKTGLKL